MKKLLVLLVLCCNAFAVAVPDSHRLSYGGVKPYTGQDGRTVGPFPDDDGFQFFCDTWQLNSGKITMIGYRYVNSAYWYRDQKYMLACDGADMFNTEAFGVNAGLVFEVGVRVGTWLEVSTEFSTSGDGLAIANFDHGYNADPIGYGLGFVVPPYTGTPAGAYIVGLKGVRSDFSVRVARLQTCFWQKTATNAGNVYLTGSKPSDPGGAGGPEGGDDPNGASDGWGSILSLDWWKKLFVFLFVPTQEDLEVIKESFTQFQNWGPFKVIADIATKLGDMAGGSMGDLSVDYKVPLPSMYF